MITQAALKELLHYDPTTGVFTWIKRPSNRVKVGDSAGYRSKVGYLELRVQGTLYRGHQLAFLYMTGRVPAEIDHINQCKGDDIWDNLRECTRSQNLHNVKAFSHNTSGIKGVFYSNYQMRWVVQQDRQGKRHSRTFHTLLDAVAYRYSFT